jgi:hypothetical protein
MGRVCYSERVQITFGGKTAAIETSLQGSKSSSWVGTSAIVTNTQYDDGGRSREEAKQKAPDLVSGQIRGSPYPAWEDRQAGMN